MAEEGEDDGIAPNDALDIISEDEATANTSCRCLTGCPPRGIPKVVSFG
jgi:hypothetical protein